MTMPGSLDPYHLLELAEEIDRRCYRLATEDFPALIDAGKLDALKASFRDETITLMTEMRQDIDALGAQIGSPVLPPDYTTLTLDQIARELPRVYADPTAPETAAEDAKARQTRLILRVRWTIDSWLQKYMALMWRLPAAAQTPCRVGAVLPPEPDAEPCQRPFEMQQVSALWGMIRELTAEYLEVKADLLREGDPAIPYVNPERSIDARHFFVEATTAFWEHRPGTDVMLLQALRYAIVDALALHGTELPVDLRLVHTSELLKLTQAAGLTLPFPLDRLCDITVHLESAAGRCDAPRISYLAPVFQLLSEVIHALLAANATPDVRERAMQILKNSAEKQHGST